jgi:hypothetical protein
LRPVLVFVPIGANGRYAGGRSVGRFYEVLIVFDPQRDANLGLGVVCAIWSRWADGPQGAQDMSFAAHGHAFSEGYLRGHAQCEFDLHAVGQGKLGEKEDSAGTQILRESGSLRRGFADLYLYWKKIRESLTHATLNPDLRCGHCHSLAAGTATNAGRYCSAGSTKKEGPNWLGRGNIPKAIIWFDLKRDGSRWNARE